MQLAIDFTAKEEGIKRVSEHNASWMEAAVAGIAVFCRTRSAFSSDDFRDWFNGDSPKHPNAWGAAFNTAAKAGVIEKTGEYRPSRSPGARARAIPMWRAKTN